MGTSPPLAFAAASAGPLVFAVSAAASTSSSTSSAASASSSSSSYSPSPSLSPLAPFSVTSVLSAAGAVFCFLAAGGPARINEQMGLEITFQVGKEIGMGIFGMEDRRQTNLQPRLPRLRLRLIQTRPLRLPLHPPRHSGRAQSPHI